jgi:hypothetical protein
MRIYLPQATYSDFRLYTISGGTMDMAPVIGSTLPVPVN